MIDPPIYTAICGDRPRRSDIPCLDGERIFERPVMDAKRYKILPHLYLPDAEITIWVDGNITALMDARELVERYLVDADLALFLHPRRATVWEEFSTLRTDPRFAIPYLQKHLTEQEAAYRTEGLPENAPLYECNFMIRRNIESVNRLMDAWWAQICRWQWRDQVSLPYVLWRYGDGVKLRALLEPDIRKNRYFRYEWTR